MQVCVENECPLRANLGVPVLIAYNDDFHGNCVLPNFRLHIFTGLIRKKSTL